MIVTVLKTVVTISGSIVALSIYIAILYLPTKSLSLYDSYLRTALRYGVEFATRA